MSAATTASCGFSSSSTSSSSVRLQPQQLQQQQPSPQNRPSTGGGGGVGTCKRVSWKLANMAAIATPESDDDFDVIDISYRKSVQPPAFVTLSSENQCPPFYHVTQDGGWIRASAAVDGNDSGYVERRNGVSPYGNGMATDSSDKDQSQVEHLPERAWAVVATPALSTASSDVCNDASIHGGRNSYDIEYSQAYVVTTAFSIARPENGPQLIRTVDSGDSDDKEISESQVVARSLVTTESSRDPSGDGSSVQTSPYSMNSTTDNTKQHLATIDERMATFSSCQSSVEEVREEQRKILKTPLHSISGMTAVEENLQNAILAPQTPTAKHFVVVAIDFGTALSGYAFGFVRDPGRSVHMMRRWEGGDPGVVNQKTPTALLLDPEGRFHSFGCAARDFYHDLDDDEARTWMYFDRFKMALHHDQTLNHNTMLTAANGRQHPALSVFAHALRYFREHALRELADQSSTPIVDDDVRWVITVPAIWRPAAKQFMRQAAIQAGMTSEENPERLLIALEPEAASIYVRTLRFYQLVPDSMAFQSLSPRNSRSSCCLSDPDLSAACRLSRSLSRDISLDDENSTSPMSEKTVEQDIEEEGSRCIVVDCGGGTVDITVHEADPFSAGRLREVYKATGGPFGSVGVDLEFEKLLVNIFGSDFIEAYKRKRPSGWVDLMVAFESRKRSANPQKDHPLNVCLPFSFIDYHKKHRGCQLEVAISKYGDKSVRWSSQGMLRMTLDAMKRLFAPTVEQIKKAIADVINNVQDIGCMFLVGGFAESPLLQQELRSAFGDGMKIFVPHDVALTVLKGAVYFGLDPAVVTRRRSMLTYGVEVLNRFDAERHPSSKRICKGGQDWCTGVFDVFVRAGQAVDLGKTIVRHYCPPTADQLHIIINIYSSERSDVQFVTDKDVVRCGQLRLDLTDRLVASDNAGISSPLAVNLNDVQTTGSVGVQNNDRPKRRREIQTAMTFGDTEIKVIAVDVTTGRSVLSSIDFLGHI